MTHPQTTALTTLLYGKPEDFEATARAIAVLFTGYSEERKADLYALIAERVHGRMGFTELSEAVDYCLLKNERYFTRA